MILKENYQEDFRPPNSISSILGISNKLHKSKFQESENTMNILNINSILVNIDIISGSYANGFTQLSYTRFFQTSLQDTKLLKLLST